MGAAPIVDQARLRRLAWRMRRGLLENDLILERFMNRQAGRIDEELVAGLDPLLELSDNELLELLLGRQEPQGDLDSPSVKRALGLLREP